MLIIHLATIVLHPVAHYQIVYMKLHVVNGYLVEHPLGEGDGGGLVLDDHPWLGMKTVKHTVTTELLLTH